MAQWPDTLPNPSKDGLSVTFGSNSMSRTGQSGRVETVRFGVGAPDRWNVSIRLLPDQLDIFRDFYNNDLNCGSNWFSASWIDVELGYSDHKGLILGYPSEVRYGGIVTNIGYKDITFEMIIKPSAACPDDTIWGQ